jgi:cytochrome P450
MYLVKHPKALKRLREELDQATVSNPTGALPSYDQVRKLTYLTACINESMRLRPVAATGN